jgi:maltose-binding protein MalE
LVQDLTILADAELQAKVDPVAWQQATYGGALIGLPLERQGIVLYRNRSLAIEAAASVEEFVTLAQQLDEGDIVGVELDLGFLYSASHMSACNGDFFNKNGEFEMDAPAGLCWLGLLQTMKNAGRVRFNAVEDMELFTAGNSAWVVESSLNAPVLAQAIGPDNLVIDPWPVYGGTAQRLAGYVWTENAYLVRGSSPMDREVSWAFVRFMLTPQAQLIFSNPDEANHIPALADLELPTAIQAQIESTLSSGVTLPLSMDWDLYWEPLEGAVRSVTTQGATPELALDVALTKIQQARTTPGEEE